jgi:regulator of ribosome biosynthesis
MESDAKKMRKEPAEGENVLNVRKAVRFASKGAGGAALAKKTLQKMAPKGRGKRERR